MLNNEELNIVAEDTNTFLSDMKARYSGDNMARIAGHLSAALKRFTPRNLAERWADKIGDLEEQVYQNESDMAADHVTEKGIKKLIKENKATQRKLGRINFKLQIVNEILNRNEKSEETKNESGIPGTIPEEPEVTYELPGENTPPVEEPTASPIDLSDLPNPMGPAGQPMGADAFGTDEASPLPDEKLMEGFDSLLTGRASADTFGADEATPLPEGVSPEELEKYSRDNPKNMTNEEEQPAIDLSEFVQNGWSTNPDGPFMGEFENQDGNEANSEEEASANDAEEDEQTKQEETGSEYSDELVERYGQEFLDEIVEKGKMAYGDNFAEDWKSTDLAGKEYLISEVTKSFEDRGVTFASPEEAGIAEMYAGQWEEEGYTESDINYLLGALRYMLKVEKTSGDNSEEYKQAEREFMDSVRTRKPYSETNLQDQVSQQSTEPKYFAKTIKGKTVTIDEDGNVVDHPIYADGTGGEKIGEIVDGHVKYINDLETTKEDLVTLDEAPVDYQLQEDGGLKTIEENDIVPEVEEPEESKEADDVTTMIIDNQKITFKNGEIVSQEDVAPVDEQEPAPEITKPVETIVNPDISENVQPDEDKYVVDENGVLQYKTPKHWNGTESGEKVIEAENGNFVIDPEGEIRSKGKHEKPKESNSDQLEDSNSDQLIDLETEPLEDNEDIKAENAKLKEENRRLQEELNNYGALEKLIKELNEKAEGLGIIPEEIEQSGPRL